MKEWVVGAGVQWDDNNPGAKHMTVVERGMPPFPLDHCSKLPLKDCLEGRCQMRLSDTYQVKLSQMLMS